MDLSNSITIFVGDNGSGKSTLLKSIAYYNNSINVSSHNIESSYYKEIKDLSQMMKCTYDVKSRKGFFFSGEEFITYINQLKQMKHELQDDLKRVNEEYKDKSIVFKKTPNKNINYILSFFSKTLNTLRNIKDEFTH